MLPAHIGAGVETDTVGDALTVAVNAILAEEHPVVTFLEVA